MPLSPWDACKRKEYAQQPFCVPFGYFRVSWVGSRVWVLKVPTPPPWGIAGIRFFTAFSRKIILRFFTAFFYGFLRPASFFYGFLRQGASGSSPIPCVHDCVCFALLEQCTQRKYNWRRNNDSQCKIVQNEGSWICVAFGALLTGRFKYVTLSPPKSEAM